MGFLESSARVSTGLPSGNVAFLFTDIEGSTVRWDRDSGAMQQAVRRHDELMRSALAAHNGHVFKTIGDAFCAVFWNIGDGIKATNEAQSALAAEDFSAVDGIRVRMALHVGASDERDGDYFGPTLNRVARLLAIGHGGQVLLSSSAVEQAISELPDTQFRDMGEHRLKDLTAPEHVFQLLVPGLPADFPKLKSLSVLDNNLPLQLTNLVGRDADLVDIKALLGTSRLVTLVGSGGVGKTRCALQAGAEVLEGYDDGVWFVDLAPLSDPALAPSAIAAIFDIQESPQQPILEPLIAHLKNKHLLLVVDNCEHLITEVAKTADAILRGCPRVAVLATSRESLGIAGESVFRMPSLAVPDSPKGLTAESALSFGAVALFEARAKAANHRFAITDDLAPAVADICRRLDGIPLAIELAAARVKVLSIPTLAQRLDERFKILTGGSRTALPRQQTMRALIDWSYELLSDRERRIFRSFSIFAGAFTLELAVAVCADTSIENFDVLDILTSLVDKSLLQAEPGTEDARYRLLESTRQYAREKLIEDSEYEAAARRHATAYVAFAEQLEEAWETTPDRAWVAKAEPEMDNWRADIAWAFGPTGEALIGQHIAVARFWQELARAEGRRYLRTALDAVTEQTPRTLVASLELAASKIDSIFGQFKSALASAERARALFEELGDHHGLAQARLCAGRALLFLDRIAEGEEMLKASLSTFRGARANKTMGAALSALGSARIMEGDISAARSLLTEAAAIYEATGADGRLPSVLSLLAEAEFRSGDVEAALDVADRGLAAHRKVKSGPNNLLYNMSAYLTALGRFEDARTRANEALAIAREEQAEADAAFTIQHLAAVGALRPAEPEDGLMRAARLLGFVDARLTVLDACREFTEQMEYEKVVLALRTALGPERLGAMLQEGHHWSEDRAVQEAQLI